MKNQQKSVKKSQISSTLLKELADSGISPLKKAPLKYPYATFYCHVCDYHCDTVAICKKHINETRHLKNVELLEQKTTVSVLPKPNLSHEEAISDLITEVANENGMSETKRGECEELKKFIEEEIKKSIPDICLLVNGSCLSGFALQDSALDLDLVIEKAKEIGNIFEQVYNIIDSIEQFKNQCKSFNGSYPQISFTDTASGMIVFIGLHNAVSIYTNELLGQYARLDCRVRTLGIAFRYWAKLCELDKFAEGTLAPRCFILMVVYFLQRCKEPVVPCLHKDRNDTIYTKPDEMKPEWKSKNESSVGSLWLELLRFYAVGINFKNCQIDITSPHYLCRTTKRSVKIGIDEPLSHKHNTVWKKWMLSQSVTNTDVYYFILNTIRNTCFYFLVPQRPYGALFCSIKDTESLRKSADNDRSSNKDNGPVWTKFSSPLNDTTDGEATEESNEPVIRTSYSSSNYYNAVDWPSYKLEEEDGPEIFRIDEYTTSFKSVEPSFALKLVRAVKKDQLVCRFETECFTKGEKVPVRCAVCHMSGHTKNNCVEFVLPPLCSLPTSYSPMYEIALTFALQGLKERHQPGDRELNYKSFILNRLQEFIEAAYPEAVLDLFGSSSNGFGFSNSDLDICLTFTDNPTGKDIDQIQIIKNLAQKFKSDACKDLEIRDILAITTAKVPIVKFSLPRSSIEVDISLYNVLALKNTQLLSTYTKIDDRFQIIGYTLKSLAKLCQIGDASRGSLSSYAYILLVIHYLQNCDPPLLPVLQELHSEESKPEDIIDGWNTCFYKDISGLSVAWKGYAKNNMSTAQLWIGLLRYYTETFDWDSNVVSIKQIAPLSRLEKMWNTQCIAIEDPFDLNHNLGGGLSRKMSTYIMKCFIRAREAFGVQAASCTNQKQIMGYAFSSSVLMDGYPPNDRGCRLCGKIGHLVKDCPRKRQIEERKKERRKREELRLISNQMKPQTGTGSGVKNATDAPGSSTSPEATQSIPPATVKHSVTNSYTMSEFFDLVRKVDSLAADRKMPIDLLAADRKMPVDLLAADRKMPGDCVQSPNVARCSKKSDLPPPGFEVNMKTPLNFPHQSANYSPRLQNFVPQNGGTQNNAISTQIFFNRNVNPHISHAEDRVAQSPLSSHSDTPEPSPYLKMSPTTSYLPVGPTNAYVQRSPQYLPSDALNVKLPAVRGQMVNRQMPQFSCTTEQTIRPMSYTGVVREQPHTDSLNRHAYDAVERRSRQVNSDALNVSAPDLMHRQFYMDTTNGQINSNVFNRHAQDGRSIQVNSDALNASAPDVMHRQVPMNAINNPVHDAMNRQVNSKFFNIHEQDGISRQVKSDAFNIQSQDAINRQVKSDAFNVQAQDAINRQVYAGTISNSAHDSVNRQINSNAFNLRAQDAISRQVKSDAFNIQAQDAINRQVHADALTRQAHMAPWGRQIPTNALPRQYPPDGTTQPMPILPYAGQPLLMGGFQPAYQQTDVYGSPVMRQMIYNKYGGNGTPPLFNGADVIPTNFGVPMSYPPTMLNSQTLPQDNKQPTYEGDMSFRP